MNTEQLISLLRQLISQLAVEKTELTEGSKAWQQKASAINHFTSILEKLMGTTQTSTKSLRTLEAQLTRLFTVMETGADASGKAVKRMSVGGMEFRTTQMKQGWGVRVPGAGGVGAGPQATDANINEEFIAAAHANAEAEKEKARANQQSSKAYTRQVNDQLGAEQQTTDAKKATAKAEKDRQKAAEKAKLEQERVAKNAAYVSSGPGAAVQARAQKIDPRFQPDTLRSIQEEPTTGISRLKYQYTTDEGIIKSTTFTVDKFGKVLVDTQKRFRDFGSAIVRDTSEVLKWSVAVALIYTPMQKLGELMQDMIQNEVALANITVTLSNSQRSVNEIFGAAADIAQEVGEEVNKVLEAYNLAYRATGGIADETTRFKTANTLLTDSLILSKLSTLSEAEAIDTLSAALRQVSEPGESLEQTLSRGRELLNQWVAVSKVANVDLETLATGFSVVGDAAEASGINANKLNAVIATIAETSSVSGREVANAARAMVSGFQSDQAKAAIQGLGISLTDASGKAKNFLDLSKEINDMYAKGLISEAQFGQIANVVGGGARRGATVATFMQNLGKIENIEKVSEDAKTSTESLDALAKVTDTVQNASTRLGNAFQELAQSLGENGGILDTFKNILNVVTGLVTAFSDLSAAAGRSGPMLLAALSALMFINTRGPDFKGKTLENLKLGGMNWVLGQGNAAQANPLSIGSRWAFGGTPESTTDKAIGFGRFISNPWTLGIGGAALLAGGAGVRNLSEGKTAQGLGNILGGAAGGAIGAALGGPVGVAIGASIGSSIGEAFVNAAESYKPQLTDLFTDIFDKAKKGGKEPATPEEAQKVKQQEAMDYITKLTGSDLFGGFMGKFDTFGMNLAGKMFGGEGFKGVNDAQVALIQLYRSYKAGRISQEEYNKALDMVREALPSAEKLANAGKPTEAEFGKLLTGLGKEQQKKALQDLMEGNLGVAGYGRAQEQIANLTPMASQFYSAFGKQPGVKPEDFFGKAATVISRAQPDVLNDLTKMAGDIVDLESKIADLSVGSDEWLDKTDQKSKLVIAANKLLSDSYTKLLSQVKLLQRVDLSGLSSEDAEKVVTTARKNYISKLDEQVKLGVITPEQKQAIIAELEDIILKTDQAVKKITGVPAEELNQALQDLKEQGAIIDKAAGNPFQTYDMKQKDFMSIFEGGQNSMYEQAAKLLTSKEYGYKLDPSTQIPILQDGILKPMTKDWKIVEFLLGEILKTEEKQLEGTYNLPEGSSFWVPYQASKLMEAAGGQAGGGKSLKDIFGEGAVTETVQQAVKGIGKAFDVELEGNQRYLTRGTTTAPQQQQPVPVTLSRDPSLKEIDYAELDRQRRTPAVATEEQATGLGFLGDFFRRMFEPLTQLNFTPQKGSPMEGLFDLSGLTSAVQNMSTKLTLQIDNKTTVQLDGRIIATLVKQYLEEDLVRYSGSASQKTLSVI